MRILFRICLVVLAGLVPAAQAQQKPSSSAAETRTPLTYAKTDTVPVVSFHKVWQPGIKVGFFNSENAEMYFEQEGSGLETVIVVQGSPGIPHDYMHPIMAPLGRYMKVVYFDRRVDGIPKNLPNNAMVLSGMVQDLDALRVTLKLNRVTLVAHGFGNTVALSYASRYPERIKRLILVSPSAVVENSETIEKRLVDSLSAEEQVAYRAAQEQADPVTRERYRYRVLFPHCFHHVPESHLLDHDSYILNFDSMARRNLLSRDTGGTDLTDVVKNITAPVLILAGRYDRVTPLTQSLDLAKALPSSHLAIFEQSGHFPQVEEGYLFTEYVRHFMFDTVDNEDDDLPIPSPVLSTTSTTGVSFRGEN